MEEITAYILKLLEVLEKEIGLFKLTAAKAAKGIGLFGIGILLLGAGIFFLAWTCFTAVEQFIGPVGAGLAATLILLGGGGIFLWSSAKNLK